MKIFDLLSRMQKKKMHLISAKFAYFRNSYFISILHDDSNVYSSHITIQFVNKKLPYCYESVAFIVPQYLAGIFM